jgi:hypothetical protein
MDIDSDKGESLLGFRWAFWARGYRTSLHGGKKLVISQKEPTYIMRAGYVHLSLELSSIKKQRRKITQHWRPSKSNKIGV